MFELTLPITAGAVWTETVLYRFSGSSDGGEPNDGLIFDVSCALYGTTQYGSYSGCTVTDGGCGTAFKLTPPATSGGAWRITVLHTFTGGTDGAIPAAGLIFDAVGALFGTTFDGGS